MSLEIFIFFVIGSDELFTEVMIISQHLPSVQAEHLTSCYWGGNSNAVDRHDPSLPYLEQYRIDFEQFKGMFTLLFPWACGTHSDVLAARLFRLLDENGDLLINFREFVSGLSKENSQHPQSNLTKTVLLLKGIQSSRNTDVILTIR